MIPGGLWGEAMIVIVGAIAELERNLIVERVRAGMRRAKLEGQSYWAPEPPGDWTRTPSVFRRAAGRSLRDIAIDPPDFYRHSQEGAQTRPEFWPVWKGSKTRPLGPA